MKKCLKVAFNWAGPDSVMHDIQKKGTKLGLEGTIQYVTQEKELKIIVCGLKEQVDQFVDLLHILPFDLYLVKKDIFHTQQKLYFLISSYFQSWPVPLCKKI